MTQIESNPTRSKKINNLLDHIYSLYLEDICESIGYFAIKKAPWIILGILIAIGFGWLK